MGNWFSRTANSKNGVELNSNHINTQMREKEVAYDNTARETQGYDALVAMRATQKYNMGGGEKN